MKIIIGIISLILIFCCVVVSCINEQGEAVYIGSDGLETTTALGGDETTQINNTTTNINSTTTQINNTTTNINSTTTQINITTTQSMSEDWDKIKLNSYWTCQQGAISSLSQTAITYFPIWFTQNVTFTRVAFHVTNWYSSNGLRIGIYQSDNFTPTTLLYDLGKKSSGVTGVQYISCNISLQKGVYFFSLVPNNTITLKGCNPYTQYYPFLGLVTTAFDYQYTGYLYNMNGEDYCTNGMPNPAAYPTLIYDPMPRLGFYITYVSD